MRSAATLSRRQFLALLCLPWPFWRRQAGMAGINFRVVRNGRARSRYIWIHGDEITARDVLAAHMKHTKGTAFFVKNDRRNVTLEGLEFDPNRMFSREGAERRLKELNTPTQQQLDRALNRLDRDREKFLRQLLPPAGGRLVALHNNARGYNMNDEIPISDQVHFPRPDTPHEFFLLTDPGDFEILQRSPYNAVLQHKAPPDDDGSLSRLAARRNVRYINIETRIGLYQEQQEMLNWLEANLPA